MLNKFFIVQKQEFLHSINTIMVFAEKGSDFLYLICIFNLVLKDTLVKDGKITQGQGQS